MPATRDAGTYSEYVTIEFAPIIIAPPPEMRRTTSYPCRAAPSGSTSLRYDWNEPITTADSSHSQRRSVGRRRPSPTRVVSTSSSARFIRGETGRSCTISQSKSRHPGAVTSARRTAVATASGVNPSSCAPSGRAARTAAAMAAASDSIGSPSTAPLMSSRALSGSRKKSPARRNSAILPSRSSRSTTTSLPPGTLNSPCMHPD